MRILLAVLCIGLALAAFIAPVDKTLCALFIVASYLSFCALFVKRSAASASADIYVAYASQSGYAQMLATQSADALTQAGVNAQSISLNQLSAKALEGTVLFIASTYGEGEAPDNGARFLKHLPRLDATQLKYAVLALGDKSYSHFCAFGQALDQALDQAGGTRLAPALLMHQHDPEVLDTWQAQLQTLAPNPLIWRTQASIPLTLIERTCLNPRSQADKVFHLKFSSEAHWQAGDLVDIEIGHEVRTYSIASSNAPLELVARQMFNTQGAIGIGSGLLTQTLQVGQSIEAHIRVHPSFHAPANDIPMILIGAGTGIAGLRAHLQARLQGTRNWLIYGERSAKSDFWFADELNQAVKNQTLTRLDLAFSRDQAQKRYVQHVLVEAQDELRSWLEQGAAMYVCGSLKGMGEAVHETLTHLLGEDHIKTLVAQQRYQRDLY